MPEAIGVSYSSEVLVLKGLGYEVGMILVNVDLETSFKRLESGLRKRKVKKYLFENQRNLIKKYYKNHLN